MLITLEQLEDCIPKATDKDRMAFIKPINQTLEEFDINTNTRIAAFLAQVAHESGNLRYTEELASGTNYEYRKDLGNLDFRALQIAHANYTTTGKFYKGRGLIQITGYFNYKECGEALGLDLIHVPTLLVEEENACRSAGWFWKKHNCNTLADQDKFAHISQAINGGKLGQANGHIERDENYLRCKRVFGLT